MFIEAVNDELDYELNEPEKNGEGSDGQRTYILLERGEYCNSCSKNPRMRELGIEKIDFQLYQLAEEKLFNMDFKVAVTEGRLIRLHFPNRIASAKGYSEFFSDVKNAANDVGAVGLAALANRGAVLASGNQFPPHLDSEYFRCMADCDKIEFELFKLLCYLICEFRADDKPGS